MCVEVRVKALQILNRGLDGGIDLAQSNAIPKRRVRSLR